MKFIALKTSGGSIKGKTAILCRVLNVSRQGFYDHLAGSSRPWKYESLVTAMKDIISEDECNDTYGRRRMYEALKLKKERNELDCDLPSEGTVRKVMEKCGLIHKPRRKPNGITKADREAQKADDLIKRDFSAQAPFEKCVTDITEIKAKAGKLYLSVIFDCYDLMAEGIAMADNMRKELCIQTVINAHGMYPEIKEAVIHSDRGSQYTSDEYKAVLKAYHIDQSMNSAGGRCHDNARCESMWARMKEELFYSRNRKSTDYTIDELKTMIWRYYMSYWNNRRICSANGGLPPAEKRRRFYQNRSESENAA